jgi:hypothetical protein
VANDLAGAQRILHQEGWFTVESYKARLKNFKITGYEQLDQPAVLKKDPNHGRLTGKAMSLMVHLRKYCSKSSLL